MPTLLHRFLDPATTSLKVCGITLADDAVRLAELGVPALGINFWPQSKRYCSAESAATFLPAIHDQILRVGVFVNADPDFVARLLDDDLIDLAQFHGDEPPEYCHHFADHGYPFIKALGVQTPEDLQQATDFRATGLLLDAHAPGLYGGTGQTIDWTTARAFIESTPDLPLILAGGITPDNAANARAAVRPAALDVASGSESAPGIKDFIKVQALLAACSA